MIDRGRAVRRLDPYHEVLLDIRVTPTTSSSFWKRTTMGKKKKWTSEERAAWKARSEDLTRRLEAAIARRKAEAARRAAEKPSSA
jgi:hypothetical protein